MTFFFDRNVGTSIPKALSLLRLPVEFHQNHFPMDEPDDKWLPVVGARGWTVVAQDYNLHVRQTEVAAIKQHSIGVFYLWGANARAWESVRVFAKAYDRLIEVDQHEQKPFVFRIRKDGAVIQVRLL